MPDTRGWRGPHPKDLDCFGEQELGKLHLAVRDLSWLLERGYSPKAALELVGNRYSLRDRQRRAMQRCAAGHSSCVERERRRLERTSLAGEVVVVDGYNVLLTLEAALSGGVLLRACDGTLRDLAAMSAHYRRVRVTRPAIALLDEFFAGARCGRIVWYLDSPVSNSGRLKGVIESVVADSNPPWDVRLVKTVDRTIASSPHIVATADSAILDRCARWFNLARTIVEESIPEAWIVDLSGAGAPE